MIVVVNEKNSALNFEKEHSQPLVINCEQKTRRDILDFKLRENNRDQLSQLRRERRSLASVNCPYLKRRYLRDGLEEEEERLEEK